MGRHCCVQGCKTGYPKSKTERQLPGQKNLRLFTVPRDPELFQKWKNVIPTGNKKLTCVGHICELHFKEDDIERYYITKLPDGSVNKIERGKLALKPNVVPHIFSILPSTSSEGAINSISIANQDVIKEEKNSSEDESNETTDIPSFQDEDITGNFKIDVELIKAPNQWWEISSTPGYIVCAKWGLTHLPEVRVIVEKDLKLKVFIKDNEVCTQSQMRKISTAEDISRLLMEVDNCNL